MWNNIKIGDDSDSDSDGDDDDDDAHAHYHGHEKCTADHEYDDVKKKE